MNRLVIIGNGFDLAHDLPTSYRDFIDDFWRNIFLKLDTELYKSILKFDVRYMNHLKDNKINNFKDFESCLKNYCINNNCYYYEESISAYYKSTSFFEIDNELFRDIVLMNKSNWVDIENEYYRLLKECLKKDKSITKLNREFDEVKTLLEKYLINNIEEKFEFSPEDIKDMLNIFQIKSYEKESLNEFYKEISIKGRKIIEEEYQIKMLKQTGYRNNNIKNPKINISNYFLSFNYTSTMNKYIKFLKINNAYLNEIHGSIIDKSNPANFGFGDEMDNDYKQIEDKNDNNYLKNIKSFQYLHTQNYRYLLTLIESGVFQVYLMGHSCGLSDRTLLNTIFEHENCCSIKIFYHEKEDGSDNYTEITQNISRHFNDKKLMREKIVNKTLCQPLPQIQIPKYKTVNGLLILDN
ncbi:MAG: AbiH family protein [Bacteroidota bacterium]